MEVKKFLLSCAIIAGTLSGLNYAVTWFDAIGLHPLTTLAIVGGVMFLMGLILTRFV
jgi:hypothetical protein